MHFFDLKLGNLKLTVQDSNKNSNGQATALKRVNIAPQVAAANASEVDAAVAVASLLQNALRWIKVDPWQKGGTKCIEKY